MRKLLLLMLFIVPSIFLWAQVKTVTGKVTNEKGEPVASATVKEVGSKNAVQSDENGNFVIKVKTGAKITISYNEYTPYSFTPTEGFNAIVLKGSSVQKLEDVVVNTALGVKKQKKEIGYATTQVSASDLTRGKATNLATALTGKVAGLTISTPNSGVGGDVRVVLRGNRSLLGNNQPIMVVDGSVVPLSYYNSINPNDIESVNVLKGAGATAVYGNEASNGALIITTKKGAKGKSSINFSSSLTVEQVSFMPKFQNQYGSNGGEAVDATGNPLYIPYENQSYGPKYDGHMVPLGLPVRFFNANGTYYDSTWMVPYSALPDEKRNFFKDATTFENNISFSNADASGGQFFVSLQDLKRNGTMPNDQYKRNTIRVSASKEVNKFTVGFNVNYAKSSTDVVGASERGEDVYQSIMQTPAHVPLTKLQDIVNNPFATQSGYFNAYYGNPYWTIANSRDKTWTDDVLANVDFSYKPLKWLTASYKISYANSTSNFEVFRKGMQYDPWLADIAANAQIGDVQGIYSGASGSKFQATKIAPHGYRGTSTNSRLQGDFLVKGTHDFNSDFGGTLMLGAQVYEVQSKINETGTDINGNVNDYDELGDIWGPTTAIGKPLSYFSQTTQRAVGMFADLSLKYKNFLYFHTAVRRDADSRLEPENRVFVYPSADLSFIFSEAIPAVKNWAPLSSGKIRVSYAKVGNISISPYQTRTHFAAATSLGFPYTDASGNTINGYLLQNTIYDKNLKPEFTAEQEVGLELVWFKNRLNTDFSYYQQNTTNQTVPTNISAATGRPNAIQNVGETQNKGFEVSLSGVLIQKRDLQWKVGVNYTHIDSKVISITQDIKSLAINLTGTYSLGGGIYANTGSLYPILQTTDWNRDTAQYIVNTKTPNPTYNMVIVDPKTGVPGKNAQLKPFGTTFAPDMLSFNTSVSYKRFTLSAVAEYRHGAVVMHAAAQNMDFSGISENSVKYNREAFVFPNSVYNTNPDPNGTPTYAPNTSIVTNMGKGAITNSINFYANLYNTVGSNYVTSADFWKLREVSLAYDIPAKFLGKTKFVKAGSIAIFGRDLLMILPKENQWTDPEFSTTTGNGVGISNNGQTPTTRKFGVSLNLTF